MRSAGVPGVSLAMIRHGRLEETVAIGLRDTTMTEAVDPLTVFDAASLSKPVVAYALLQLVDASELTLDEPLSRFVPRIDPDHAASDIMTTRHVLTHTSGLPNVRASAPASFHFSPGAHFSYCSIGFAYLQKAIECITEEPFETTMRRLVLDPLGMSSSSFEWQGRFRHNFASPHEHSKRLTKGLPGAAASYSLQTTATDYAAFLMATLKGIRLNEPTFRHWLTPFHHVPKGTAIHLDDTPLELEADVAWGLGWGLEISNGTFFQWGKIDGIRSFTMGSVIEQSALVLFTNSNTGLRLMPEITELVLPGKHPAISWLNKVVTE